MKFLIGEKLFREVKVDRATVQEDGRTVELLFSSEEPVEKFFGTESLINKEASDHFSVEES